MVRMFDSILSRMGELITDRVYENANGIFTLKTLQKTVKALSAKAYDVEEEIKNAEQSRQKKRKREIGEWLEDVKSTGIEVLEYVDKVESAGFIGKILIGGKSRRLNEAVEKLVDQSRYFGELVVDVCESRGVRLPTTRMVGGTFEQNLEKICGLLETGQVSRIGVHGMGGAGKTTLAMHINNRILEQSPERSVFWVTVSQEFTIKSLQDKIACSLGVEDFFDGDDEVIKRAAKLHEALSEMENSVLILDDVWEYIDLLKLGFPVSKECCRLIITTRSVEVCHQIGCEERIAVQKLDEDEAWKLFRETFTLGEEIRLDREVEEIAKSVAKLCDGLPLGIITLAGSMRGETAIHTWRNAFLKLKEPVMEQDGMLEVEVFKVLKYSFDRLNKHVESESNEEFNLFQLCFLYCSLYPEDHNIPRKELVSKFIYEGLLERRKSWREQVDQCHIIVDKLVKVCLLKSCVDLDGVDGVECVKMHDLVRLMALKIGGGKYMVRAGDWSLKEIPKDEEWTEDLEKVSLMKNDIRGISEGTSPNCPKLSTLLLRDNDILEYIPDSFFTKMQGLSTLDLCRTGITKLPNSISELESLKALLLEGCEKLEEVPCLEKLKALRELNLDGTAIKEVPQGVEELLDLKFLSIDARHLEMLPQGLLLKLVRLQYVKFPHHLDVAIEEIKNKGLEELRGRVKNVQDFNRFIASRVLDTFYKIRVGQGGSSWDADFGYFNKEVMMYECNLKEEEVSGKDIEGLSITECGLSKCFLDDFSRLNSPTSLKGLGIDNCGGIECILTSEQLTSARELASQFSSTVEIIHLNRLENFNGLVEKAEIGGPSSGLPAQAVFSSLTRLMISWCNKMRKLGLSVSGFPNLESLYISDCVEMEEIFEDEGSAASLPKLQQLWLIELPRLKSVCKTAITCNSIEAIKIKECPTLMNKMPLHLDVPPPPTLRTIKVDSEWWESLKWDNPDLLHYLRSLVSFESLFPSIGATHFFCGCRGSQWRAHAPSN